MPIFPRFLRSAVRRRFAAAPSPAAPAITSPNTDLKVGDTLGKFTVRSSRDFPDYHIRLYVLEHVTHGTQYLHFDSSDANKSFAFHFRTLPVNDKGIPHILEHTVLCGSEKFPVKDPFFAMLKRSLNTYMNAWTGPDLTMYPFSTTNDKDFLNLLRVYSDAVFRPKLSREDFLQEGWRLEFEDGKLQFKGVVFNEMKGDSETQNAVFVNQMARKLFQGSEFANNFGGDPACIPDLTHDELKSFYQRYYHPSNCGLVSYGNLDVRSVIDFLEANYLEGVPPSKSTFNPKKSALHAHQEIVASGPADPVCMDPNANSQFAITFLCDGLLNNPLDYVGMEILGSVLFNLPSSPFYQEFLAKKIGTDYCVANGFGDFIRFPVFTLGLRDVANDVDKIRRLKADMMALLAKIRERGLNEMLVESVLHSYELRARLSKENFGISLFGGLTTPLNYSDLDLIAAHLSLSETMRQIREKVAAGNYLEELIQKYLLDNPKRLDFALIPDAGYTAGIIQKEADRLTKMAAELTPAQKEQIEADARNLRARQDRKHNFDVLPKLSVSDISRAPRTWQKQYLDVDGIPTLFVSEFTNCTTHFRVKIDLGAVPRNMLRYLSFLEDFIPKLGTKHNDYAYWGTHVSRFTSGIKASIRATSSLDGTATNAFLLLESSCLDRNMDVMFSILAEILTEFDTNDTQRVSQLLSAFGYEAGLAFSSSAHEMAQAVAEAGVTRPAWLFNDYEMVG